MSGIYIPGMEMPKGCEVCAFSKSSCTGESIYCGIDYSTVPWSETEKPFDCPLVEVPDHGRLIDADAIPFVISEDGCMDDWAFRYDINDMPTIVPADKDGEA